MVTDDFVVSGTCTEQMYGMCESLWEPNMVSWWHGAGLGSQVPTPWPSGENVFTWQVMGRMVQVGKKVTAAEPWKGIQKLHLLPLQGRALAPRESTFHEETSVRYLLQQQIIPHVGFTGFSYPFIEHTFNKV